MRYAIGITIFYGIISFVFPGPILARMIFGWDTEGYFSLLYLGLILLCFIITCGIYLIYQELKSIMEKLEINSVDKK